MIATYLRSQWVNKDVFLVVSLLLMIIQHCVRVGLGFMGQQAITLTMKIEI